MSLEQPAPESMGISGAGTLDGRAGGGDWIANLFAPRSVALIGASEDPHRAGGRLVTYMATNGYTGRIYCVNPGRSTVSGLPCFPTIADVPEPVDLALVAVNAKLAPDVVAAVGRAGVPVAVVFASGFAELGVAGAQLQQRLAEAVRDTGVRVLGPNTAGVRATHLGLFGEQGTNLGTVGYRTGSVAMVSQSGALGGYFGSTYLKRMGVGTRYFVDTGNEVDIDAADCVDYIARDDAVSCIALILEATADGRKLTQTVAKATANGKPVLVLKVGRTEAGMRAASSHTAAMASQVELFEAELAAAGAFVTRDEVQLADALLLHATGCAPAGNRVAVITPSGGFGVLALDLASEMGLELPDLPLPGDALSDVGLGGSTNPLELAALAGRGTELLSTALDHVSAQPTVDAVVLWHPHRLLDAAEGYANAAALIASRERSGKPHFHCGMLNPDLAERLVDAGVATFSAPRRLFSAISAVCDPAARIVASPAVDRAEHHATALAPAEARAILAEIGLSTVETRVVATADQAVQAGEDWGAPVFLKLESQLATHKTEAGLVLGPLAGSSIGAAFAALAGSGTMARDAAAQIVAQPLVTGVELALGGYVDPIFGPSVVVAHGGIYVEILRDAAFAAAPIDLDRALSMLGGLRIYPALVGARGRRLDVTAVAEALVALSRFVGSVSDPAFSIDINPLIVRAAGAVAVDARVFATAGVIRHARG